MYAGSIHQYTTQQHTLTLIHTIKTKTAFLQPDPHTAQALFDQAKAKFQRALRLDPSNMRYKQLLDAMESAPQLHAQVWCVVIMHNYLFVPAV